jgi:8-oxo-dGTP pyrophosphatase MutT (NUDIX family)
LKKENTKGAPIGKTNPPSASDSAPYVGTAIVYQGLVLLGKRILVCPHTGEKVKFGGFWSVFAGAVEKNESHYLAAHREVLEETGFDLDKSRFEYVALIRGMRLYIYQSPELIFPKIDYEHTESGWFKIENLRISPSPVDKALAKAIQAHTIV